MLLSPSRLRRVSESDFPWQREALQFLADQLPNQEPVRMWSTFEFSSNGDIDEMDALILTGKGLFIVEVKSRPVRRPTSLLAWWPGEAAWTHRAQPPPEGASIRAGSHELLPVCAQEAVLGLANDCVRWSA